MIGTVLDNLNYRFNLPRLNVYDAERTVNLIINKKANIVRFGDGEIELIEGRGITYQDASPELSKKLRDILFLQNNNNLLVCIPDFFNNLDRYTKTSQKFWRHNIRVNSNFYKDLAKTNKYFGSAQISRPYLNRKNKAWSDKFFKQLKSIRNGKSILIVEGENSRSGIGNDLFTNAASIRRIICPPKNSFAKLKEIEKCIVENREDSLVLLMLGPTAKVIVNDLSYLPNQLIDIGHIDSEYEWFLRKSMVREKIPGKHTAEYNNDKDIDLKTDPLYESQIIDIIK